MTKRAPDATADTTEHETDTLAVISDQLATIQAQIGGFAADNDEWEWVECDGEGVWAKLTPTPGADPFRAEILTSLTFAEEIAIPVVNTTYQAIWPHLVGRVRAWNVKARDVVTGEWTDVPSPNEGGIDSLRAAPKLATEWLAFVLKYAHLRGAFPKASTQPGGMDGPPNADD